MVRGRSCRRVLALAIAPALAACSLVYKSDLDDARQPYASSTDAGGDAIALPVGPADAGADVVTTPTGCAAYPTAKFCADFDTRLNVDDGWDKFGLSSDTTTKVAFDALAYSAPRSFRASLAEAPDCSYARLEKQFDGVGNTRATLSAHVRPQAPWRDDGVILFMSLTGCSILLSLGERSPSFTSYVNVQFGDPLQNYVRQVDGFAAPDEWTDVTLDAKTTDKGVRLDVVFDHASGARDDKQLDLAQCSLKDGTSFIGLGFHCTQGSHDVRYDDVRMSWE